MPSTHLSVLSFMLCQFDLKVEEKEKSQMSGAWHSGPFPGVLVMDGREQLSLGTGVGDFTITGTS